MKVLIFEPNPFHYEVIPGFVYYFLRLGYEVDCLVQGNEQLGDVFCRCSKLREKIKIHLFESDNAVETLAKLQKENNYDILFFNSIDLLNKMCRQAVVQISPMFENGRKMFGCSHALFRNDKEFTEIMRLFRNRIVTLSETEVQVGKLFEVNPHYYCDEVRKGKFHNPVVIVGIGENLNRNELLSSTSCVYRKTGNKPRLIFVGKKERLFDKLVHMLKYIVIIVFRIRKYDITRHQPAEKVNRCVNRETKYTGKLSFDDMFSQIEEADFIALNIYDGEKKDFSTSRTSGSKQLSLGFVKPCIIEKKMADYYGFTEKNAVIYENGHLEEALEKVVSMSDGEYEDMVRELGKMSDEVVERSLKNLEGMLQLL